MLASSIAPNSGPSYTPEDVCAASALLNKGLPTLLDAVGIIPLEGRVVKATQFAAALFSAGLATFGESTPTDAAFSGTSLGLSGIDNAHVMTSGAEVVPILAGGPFKRFCLSGADFAAESLPHSVELQHGQQRDPELRISV